MLIDGCIESERIFLRSLQVDDATDEYLRWMTTHDTIKYLESRFNPPKSKAELRKYIGKVSCSQSDIIAGIFTNDDQTHIGNIKIGPLNFNHGIASIGFMIGSESYRSKGFAVEAVKAVCEYLFTVHKIYSIKAGCYSLNLGSKSVLEKCGFDMYAVCKNDVNFKGQRIDSLLFCLQREEQAMFESDTP